MAEIDEHLRRLISLWVSSDAESFLRVPLVCEQILKCAAEGPGHHPQLLERASRVAHRAQERLKMCIEIDTRTGSYSQGGCPEVAPRLSTVGWEG